jgi:hypothetical protein
MSLEDFLKWLEEQGITLTDTQLGMAKYYFSTGSYSTLCPSGVGLGKRFLQDKIEQYTKLTGGVL